MIYLFINFIFVCTHKLWHCSQHHKNNILIQIPRQLIVTVRTNYISRTKPWLRSVNQVHVYRQVVTNCLRYPWRRAETINQWNVFVINTPSYLFSWTYFTASTIHLASYGASILHPQIKATERILTCSTVILIVITTIQSKPREEQER